LLIAVDTSRPGGLMGSLGIVAQLVPMGVSVVLGGCLAMLAWQPDWVAVELRRLALALTVTAAIVAVAGAASTAWLLAMLLAVAVFAGLAHVLRRRPVGDRVAA
jgi:predicted phage tail protein